MFATSNSAASPDRCHMKARFYELMRSFSVLSTHNTVSLLICDHVTLPRIFVQPSSSITINQDSIQVGKPGSGNHSAVQARQSVVYSVEVSLWVTLSSSPQS